MSLHVAILELSVLDSSGHETIREGRFLGPNPQLRDMESEGFFDTALARGEFIGGAQAFSRHLSDGYDRGFYWIREIRANSLGSLGG